MAGKMGLGGMLGAMMIPGMVQNTNQNSNTLPDGSFDTAGAIGSLVGLAGGAAMGGMAGKYGSAKLAKALRGKKIPKVAKSTALGKYTGGKGYSGLNKLRNSAANFVGNNSGGMAAMGAGLGGLYGSQMVGSTIHQQNAQNAMQQMAVSDQLAAQQQQLDMQSLPARNLQF